MSVCLSDPMGEITVDPNGVLKLLNNLKIHKAPGPDGLSARVLKECSSEIAPILAHSRGAEVTGQLRLYGKYEQLRFCTLDDRSIAVLIMCLHPKKISQTHTQRVADTLYLSCM